MPFFIKVEVALKFVPFIIGSRGSIIKHIADETKTVIASPHRSDFPSYFYVGATSETNLLAARDSILDIVKKNDPSQMPMLQPPNEEDTEEPANKSRRRAK